jgi:hypothetical protein
VPTQGATDGRNDLNRQGYESDPCSGDAHYCECVPFTWFRTGINDEAGASTGGTTALERMPVQDDGRGLAVGKLGRCAPEAADHGPRRVVVVAVTNGRLDFGTWQRIFWVSWIADT